MHVSVEPSFKITGSHLFVHAECSSLAKLSVRNIYKTNGYNKKKSVDTYLLSLIIYTITREDIQNQGTVVPRYNRVLPFAVLQLFLTHKFKVCRGFSKFFLACLETVKSGISIFRELYLSESKQLC